MQTLIQVQGYNRTAHNVNSIYRPLAIALLFGLIMLASLLVCVAACIGHTPRLTAFLLLILWIFSGAILFIGTGTPRASCMSCTAATSCTQIAVHAPAARLAPALWDTTAVLRQSAHNAEASPSLMVAPCAVQEWCRCPCRSARTPACMLKHT